MNEQENVALIRKMYAAFSAGDVQTLLDNIADTAEWINHGPESIPYAGRRSGKKQIREFFEAIGDTTMGAKVTPGDFVASGDNVAVTGRYTARVRNTGSDIDTPVAHLFTLRNGKVTRWEGYSDTAHVADAHTAKAGAGGR